MITVEVTKIIYDTRVRNENKFTDMRHTISHADLPTEAIVELNDDDFADYENNPAALATFITKAIEHDWLVDGFHWRVIEPFVSEEYSVFDPVRA